MVRRPGRGRGCIHLSGNRNSAPHISLPSVQKNIFFNGIFQQSIRPKMHELRITQMDHRTKQDVSAHGSMNFEMSIGAMATATATGYTGTTLRSNYWLDQPAASFGWTVEAAAGQPHR